MCTACLQVFGLYLSTYIVVIISIDRCMAIMDPISKNRGPRRVKIMIAIAWILSAVFSVPQVRALSPDQLPRTRLLSSNESVPKNYNK